jgi:N-acetylneuraminic acid mutarotase
MPIIYKNRRISSKTVFFYVLQLSIALLCLLQEKAYGQWVKKADELHQTAEGNNVVYRNKLYVFGGFSKNPLIENRNEVYDIATDTWKDIAPFPVGHEITHNGIVLVDDNVWLIGGRAVDSHGPVSSQVIIYNITSNKWIDGPTIINPSTGKAFPLGGGGYALLGRTIHVFGGFGPTICEDQSSLHLTINVDDYIADPQHTTWENKLAPMPIPRNHISYIVLGGKIYALGGQFKHDCGALDQKYCHVYDPETDQWTRLTDLPIVRSHAEASSFSLDGKILLVAGQGVQDIPQNTVYEFNPVTNNGLGSWTNKTNYKLPGKFLGLSSKIIGSQFIITNGALDNYANSRKETYSYNVPRSTARTLGFASSCISEVLDTGEKKTIKNFLYVLEDSLTYHITTDQSWMSVAGSSNGVVTLNGKDIQVNINADNLLPGNYTGQIKATGSNAAVTTTFCVTLVVKPKLGYSLTTQINGSGTLTKTPDSLSYTPGSQVVIAAHPSAGWKFENWTGDTTSSASPLTLYMDSNKQIIANFEKLDDDGLITNITPSTSSIYSLGTLTKGAKYYSDRDYQLTSIPAGYVGLPSIITANDDKLNKSTNLLLFTLSDSATVFLAYDSRAVTLPAWLKTWKSLGDKIGINDPKLKQFNVFSKSFSAGSKVTLGGNLASPASGALCSFIVFARAENSVDTNSSFKLASFQNGEPILDQSELKTATNNKLVLYPNPFHDNFKIIMPDNFTGVSIMSVADMYGKTKSVPFDALTTTGKTIAVNSTSLLLKPGLYSLKIISTNKKVYFTKMIVQ